MKPFRKSLDYTTAEETAAGFDEWVLEQPADIKDTVRLHLDTLKGLGISGISARVLLANLYLVVRKSERLEGRMI